MKKNRCYTFADVQRRCVTVTSEAVTTEASDVVDAVTMSTDVGDQSTLVNV